MTNIQINVSKSGVCRSFSKELITLYCVFYISPFCDALTGFLVLNGYMSEGSLATPSQLVKFITMLLLLFQQENKNFLKICILGIYDFILELISYCVFKVSLYQFLYGIMQFYKVIYLIALFYFLHKLVINKVLVFKQILEFSIYSGLIYGVILVSTTLLGFNVPTYSEGTFGSKGVFASGNGLSVYLGFSSALAVYYSIKYKDKKLIAFFLCFASTIIGTKASLIFLILNLCIVFYYSPVWIKIIFIVVIGVSAVYIGKVILKVFDVIVLRYKNSTSLFSFLASNRDNYIYDAFKQYDTNGIKSLRIIFGSGAFASYRSNPDSMKEFDTLENDFFDIFFMYGAIVLMRYLLFQIKYIFMAIKAKQFNLAFIFISICFYSLWAGHSVFNSMSGTGLSVLAILIFSYSYSYKQKFNVVRNEISINQ